MKAMQVTIDSGKRFGKRTNDGKKVYRFDSMLDALPSADYSYKNLIELDNQYYILGSEAGTLSYDSTKEIMLHKLSAYYSICQYIKFFGEHVNLVINMPITQYMDVNQRESFKRFIQGDKDITMKIGREDFYFIIDNVLPVAEGTGIIFSHPELFENKSAIICNIGGLNSTCLQVNNKKIVRSIPPFNSNYGGNILESDIRREINKNGKYNYQQHEIQFLFDSDDSYIQDAIKYCSERQLHNIITEMKSRNYNVEGCKNIYFEGGTALRLKNVIESQGFTVIEDAFNADINGSHLFGVKHFG